jgi:hypothetical protein
MGQITFSVREMNKYKLVPKKGWYHARVVKVGDGRKSNNSDAIVFDCEVELVDEEVEGTIVSFWPNDKMQSYAAKFYAAAQNLTPEEFMQGQDQDVDMDNCKDCELLVEVSHRKNDKGENMNEVTDFAPMKSDVKRKDSDVLI